MKFVLIFVVLLGAAWAIKPVRAKLGFIFDPIAAKVEPMTANIRNSPKRWAAKNECTIILRKIAEEYAETKKLPSASSFPLWIKTKTRGGNKGQDPWGSNYYFVHEVGKVTVGSRGPDKIRNTPDDVTASAPLGN